jgi:geranylgeranyl diphosphate synthase type I
VRSNFLPDHLGVQIEHRLCEAVEEALCDSGIPEFATLVRAFVMNGGKRIRPALCAWSWMHASGTPFMDPLPRAVVDVACAWELFHAFLLIHDDLMDRSDQRRRRPSLHRQLAGLDAGSSAFGGGLALIAGDLLHSGALRLVHECGVPQERHVRLLRLFSRIGMTTGFGQAAEMILSHRPVAEVDEALVLREYHRKTAAYTFEGPLLAGAILAGMDDRALGSLSEFSRAAGVAYQLQNDLADLCSPCSAGSDLVEGKRTAALVRYRQSLSEPQRQALDARLNEVARACTNPVASAERLRRDMVAGGVIQITQGLLREQLALARSFAGHADLPKSLSDALSGLVGEFDRAYFDKDPSAGVESKSGSG